ncbi:MAG: hypothetical protein FJW79_06525 [Actinobacteria bacterium]|nr:hypothetical protein [Actinomycetota bacterium]
MALPEREAWSVWGLLSGSLPLRRRRRRSTLLVLGAAQEALLATSVPGISGNPWNMAEEWQPWWCLRSQRRHLRAFADARGVSGPRFDYYFDWVAWAVAHPGAFSLLCGDVVAQFGNTATAERRTFFGEHAGGWLLFHLREAVAIAQAEASAAEGRFSKAKESYDAAVAEAVATIVEEARAAQGAQSERVIRDSVSDAEGPFCRANEDAVVLEAAASLGFLPVGPSSDLVTYWWATRPDEYIRARNAAYALR